MFKEERESSLFQWSDLGDLEVGRPNLGAMMPVQVYRLMQFTMRDQLIQQFGPEATDKVFYQAGKTAGEELYKNVIMPVTTADEFVNKLQDVLKDLHIGILRIEKMDYENLHFILTVAEDLDCSGLSVCDEQICVYDEGFVAGLFHSFIGREFNVKEIDCWCSGDRVCRFEVRPV